MKISKAHVKRLKASRKLKGKEASTLNMFFKNWKYYTVVAIVFCGASYFFITEGNYCFSFALGGAYIAMLLRDIVWFRLISRFWPVSDAVTNWEKVDELIEENET